MRILATLAALALVAGCGDANPNNEDGAGDAVIASVGAADAPRANGVDHYAISYINSQGIRLRALSPAGYRVATYTASRTQTGFTAQILAGKALPGALRALTIVASSARNDDGSIVLTRTFTDGKHSVSLDQTLDRASQSTLSFEWRAGKNSLSYDVNDPQAGLKLQNFLYQNGVSAMLQSGLARVLVAIANDPGLRGYGQNPVYDIDWGAGLGCAVDVAKGALEGGLAGAAVGGATSGDCWDFFGSVWDWLWS